MKCLDKKEKAPAPLVGGSSLLVIFSVLCLTIFATLCLAQVPVYKGEIKTESPRGYRFATFYKDCNQSISVGASNIDLYEYITPEVSVESSYKENECNKSFPISNITTYKYNKYCRINRRSQAGDWLKYSLLAYK